MRKSIYTKPLSCSSKVITPSSTFNRKKMAPLHHCQVKALFIKLRINIKCWFTIVAIMTGQIA